MLYSSRFEAKKKHTSFVQILQASNAVQFNKAGGDKVSQFF